MMDNLLGVVLIALLLLALILVIVSAIRAGPDQLSDDMPTDCENNNESKP